VEESLQFSKITSTRQGLAFLFSCLNGDLIIVVFVLNQEAGIREQGTGIKKLGAERSSLIA